VSILTIFISTYLPAMKASRISAIDAIRQTTDVKLTRKAVKTSRLIRMLFGIVADIGLKNLKRNKRRYQATVFSLVISIVLFMAVSYFTDNLKKSLELSQDGVSYDIQVYGRSNDANNEKLLQSIAALENVTQFTLMKGAGANAWIDEASISDELKKRVKEDPGVLQDGKFQYYVNLYGLDKQSLQAYAASIG